LVERLSVTLKVAVGVNIGRGLILEEGAGVRGVRKELAETRDRSAYAHFVGYLGKLTLRGIL